MGEAYQLVWPRRLATRTGAATGASPPSASQTGVVGSEGFAAAVPASLPGVEAPELETLA